MFIACFGRADDALITEIAKQTPYCAVFRDASFSNDSAMVNFEQIFATYSPSTIRRVESIATAKRQEVGRGLRLCVNNTGDRQDIEVCGEAHVHGPNMLTVIASESYAGFVADLQSKIKEYLYERPTKASVEYFTGKTFLVDDTPRPITAMEAQEIFLFLRMNNYIDRNTDTSWQILA